MKSPEDIKVRVRAGQVFSKKPDELYVASKIGNEIDDLICQQSTGRKRASKVALCPLHETKKAESRQPSAPDYITDSTKHVEHQKG